MHRIYHILVVEDDFNTNQVICEFLKNSGYTVTAAFGGDAAIDCFFEHPYDLVILDIMLTALSDEYTQIKSFDLQADE